MACGEMEELTCGTLLILTITWLVENLFGHKVRLRKDIFQS